MDITTGLRYADAAGVSLLPVTVITFALSFRGPMRIRRVAECHRSPPHTCGGPYRRRPCTAPTTHHRRRHCPTDPLYLTHVPEFFMQEREMFRPRSRLVDRTANARERG